MYFTLTASHKQLHVCAVNLHGPENEIGDLRSLVEPIFKELSPFLKLERQILFARDNKGYAIDGIYPGGHTLVPNETQIAVPSWPANRVQLLATIAHELHHMARWQNTGYGKTLGEALVSEGAAVWYEELKSGWKSPWARAKVSNEATAQAQRDWNDAAYNHHNWFYQGQYGKWVGYNIGYSLVSNAMKDSQPLSVSIKASAKELDSLSNR